MGFELNDGALYTIDSNDKRFELGDDLYGDIEIDACSPNEIPDAVYYLQSAASASFSCEMTFTGLDYLDYKPFEPAKNFIIEHNIGILVQARWHKKKRINKKWLKRYGMKSDTVKMKADAHRLSYDIDTGRLDFEVDKLEYIWRPDQQRKNLKIEM